MSYVNGPVATMAPGNVGSSVAICPSGVVIGGGWAGPLVASTVGFNEPISRTAWQVVVSNESPIVLSFNAVATCAS